MLEIIDLSVCYDKKNYPIQNLSFTLNKGKIGCILGLSGIGKSTLIKTLGTIIDAEKGSIKLNKKIINPKVHNIGYVSQNYGLYPWKTVYKNIILANKIKKKQIDSILFDKVVTYLELNNILDRYPNTLSGGQKQRVALARAFVLQPDLLLLDEPFSSLDENTRENAQRLFMNLWTEYKPTTLLVTHSVEEAIRLGYKIYILKQNNIFLYDNNLFNKKEYQDEKYLEFKNLLKNTMKEGE